MAEPLPYFYTGRNRTLPVIESSDGASLLNIQSLSEETGLYTFDPALRNTAIARTKISYIDGKHNRLFYRGYDIEELVAKSTFVETSYLLIHGELPTVAQITAYSRDLSKHSMIHESMRTFFDAFPGGKGHPLAILATMITALSGLYPESFEETLSRGVDIRVRLLAKVRTLAAWSHKKSVGQPIIYPRDEFPYCTNFLNMMFAIPAESYEVPREDDRILNQMLILYADHEMNATTTAVRIVASARANLFACINAGICALWGSRESDAVMPPALMLIRMIERNLSAEQYFEKFIQGREQLKLGGFGHGAYEGVDPRAKIARRLFQEFLKVKPDAEHDPLIQKGLEVEDYTLNHPLFKQMNLYPNVDFYSALVFKMIGIPPEMNNVVRTIGKLAGWLAHWSESREELSRTVYRPRQLYVGEIGRTFVERERRG